MTGGLITAMALVLSICVYFASVGELFLYLEKHHPRTWRELGEPWPWNYKPSNIFSATKFVFFGGALRLWDDPRLRARIIGVWASFALVFVVFIYLKSTGG